LRRFAGCPICNLHLREIARRHDELVAAGIPRSWRPSRRVSNNGSARCRTAQEWAAGRTRVSQSFGYTAEQVHRGTWPIGTYPRCDRTRSNQPGSDG
jgi:hypothetical protein